MRTSWSEALAWRPRYCGRKILVGPNLHSAPATTLPKSGLSLVPTTARTQTAYCIGPAIRCMIDLTDAPGSRQRVQRTSAEAPVEMTACAIELTPLTRQDAR